MRSHAPSSAQPAQGGTTKKSSFRMLETAWARVSTGAMAAATGVLLRFPMPAAEAPMSTILSPYFSAGMRPLYTS